jgi:hypothetical protein
MLHENPLMADIDVDHWRNLQELLLESGKAKRRIILIHENGELLKFVHSQRQEIVRNVARVDDPPAVAEKVYRANSDKTDFVVALERRTVERFFAQVQDTWSADEDLDVYVHRMFDVLDEYDDGIVTYPGKASTNLGLQWRLGASYEDVLAAVKKFVPADTTVVFGVFTGDTLWACLVLGFDGDKRIVNITTADPTELTSTGNWQDKAKEVVSWANKKFTECSIGLFTDLDSAKDFLRCEDKLAALKRITEKGKLLAEPLPQPLAKLLKS